MIKFINISENLEELMLFKYTYEQNLINSKTIENKMTFNEFLKYINIDKHIYIKSFNNPINIPFSMFNVDSDLYIIYVTEYKEYEQQFKNVLSVLNYDLSNLYTLQKSEYNKLEELDNNVFIINGEYCMF